MSELGAEFWAELGVDCAGVRAAEAEADEADGFGAAAALGSARRELKVEMKSITAGESPRRLVKCSTASVFESVEA